jgi:peptidoglycan/xylan/chitin deacetylase (PgdA/CDA1 family)
VEVWFRMPYGAYNDQVLAVLSARGYKYSALWSDDTQDSLDQDLDFQKNVISEAAEMFPAPRLILQHSIYETSTSPLFEGIQRQRGKNQLR